MSDLEAIPRYPLAWPVGWVRTLRHLRRRPIFSTKKVVGGQLTVALATDRLQAELDRLGARNPTLSTNMVLRIDGRPRSDQPDPADPGAAVYFSFKGKVTVMACDRFRNLADNIAAIAGHVEALRRIDRYGVGSLEQALAGYKALPADTAADWRSVFGFDAGLAPSMDALDDAYKKLARAKHPDVAHDDGAAMAHLNRARDFALEELTGRR